MQKNLMYLSFLSEYYISYISKKNVKEKRKRERCQHSKNLKKNFHEKEL